MTTRSILEKGKGLASILVDASLAEGATGMAAVRTRVKLEIGAAVTGGLLAILTMIVPDWIEVTGWDPDQHSGAAEWWVAVFFLVVAVTAAVAARVEWRHATASSS